MLDSFFTIRTIFSDAHPGILCVYVFQMCSNVRQMKSKSKNNDSGKFKRMRNALGWYLPIHTSKKFREQIYFCT